MNQKLIQTVISECHRIEEDALYSSKSHYNVSDRWDKLNLWFRCTISNLNRFEWYCRNQEYSQCCCSYFHNCYNSNCIKYVS